MLKSIGQLLLVVWASSLAAQDTLHLQTTAIQPDFLAKDSSGHYYLSTQSGTILRYDSDTRESIYGTVPALQYQIDGIDTRFTFKTFVYSLELQQIVLYSRWLSNPVTYNLQDFNILARAVSWSSTNELWVLDQLSGLLLKIDLVRRERVLEVRSDVWVGLAEIKTFWEWNNTLYISDEKATYQVSQQGFVQQVPYLPKNQLGESLPYNYVQKSGYSLLITP